MNVKNCLRACTNYAPSTAVWLFVCFVNIVSDTTEKSIEKRRRRMPREIRNETGIKNSDASIASCFYRKRGENVREAPTCA